MCENGGGDDGFLPLVDQEVGLTNAEHCMRRRSRGGVSVGFEEPCLVDGGNGGEFLE